MPKKRIYGPHTVIRPGPALLSKAVSKGLVPATVQDAEQKARFITTKALYETTLFEDVSDKECQRLGLIAERPYVDVDVAGAPIRWDSSTLEMLLRDREALSHLSDRAACAKLAKCPEYAIFGRKGKAPSRETLRKHLKNAKDERARRQASAVSNDIRDSPPGDTEN
jgi:hypothetical protein